MNLSLTSIRRENWLADLAENGVVSTPALVIDTSEIDIILSYFEKYLPQAKIFYAVKANNAPILLQYLANKGLSFDVSSSQEIIDLRQLGVAPSRMILSNPVKSVATINSFFDSGLRRLSLDNHYDLVALKSRQARGDFITPVDVFIRTRISSTDVEIDLNSKFGCSEEEAVQLLKSVSNAGFNPRGIQFHVGTQSWNAHNYRVGLETAFRILEKAELQFGIKCDSINIGGGFPDPWKAKEAGGIETFFEELAEALSPAIKRGLNIIAEPGRILVSGACSAMCTVIGKNIRNGTPWLYLDDGAYGLFSGKFFDHKEYHFRVIKQAKSTRHARHTPYVVAGPTCDSLDIIAQPTMLPPDLEPGDILCSHNMGAYSIVTASTFNGFGRIGTYLGTSTEETTKINFKSHSKLNLIRKVVNNT